MQVVGQRFVVQRAIVVPLPDDLATLAAPGDAVLCRFTAPLITTGVVDLPSVGKGQRRPDHVVEVVVASDDKLRLRVDGKEGAPVAMRDIAKAVMGVGDGETAEAVTKDKTSLLGKFDLKSVLSKKGKTKAPAAAGV